MQGLIPIHIAMELSQVKDNKRIILMVAGREEDR